MERRRLTLYTKLQTVDSQDSLVRAKQYHASLTLAVVVGAHTAASDSKVDRITLVQIAATQVPPLQAVSAVAHPVLGIGLHVHADTAAAHGDVTLIHLQEASSVLYMEYMNTFFL